MIAGHDFTLTPMGRRCTIYSATKGGTCMAPWLHVRTCRKEDIGKTEGFSHYGTPTIAEYAEIRTEIDREVADIWEAVIDAASAGSR